MHLLRDTLRSDLACETKGARSRVWSQWGLSASCACINGNYNHKSDCIAIFILLHVIILSVTARMLSIVIYPAPPFPFYVQLCLGNVVDSSVVAMITERPQRVNSSYNTDASKVNADTPKGLAVHRIINKMTMNRPVVPCDTYVQCSRVLLQTLFAY